MPPKAKRRFHGVCSTPASLPQRETRSSLQNQVGESSQQQQQQQQPRSRSPSPHVQPAPMAQLPPPDDAHDSDAASSPSRPSSPFPTSEPFAAPFDLGDVTFSVEGRHVYANKAVLSMWSPVMKAMFEGAFVERTMKVIDLPGKKYDDILELVQVLHPPIREVRGRYVESLLALAREYLIKPLTARCEDYLLDEDPSIHNLLLADDFDLPELKKKCLDFAKRQVSYKELRELDDADFERLSLDVQNEILRSKAYRYEQVLGYVRAVAAGRRPTNNSCRHSGNVGSSSTCKDCTQHMIRNIQYEIDNIEYGLDSD